MINFLMLFSVDPPPSSPQNGTGGNRYTGLTHKPQKYDLMYRPVKEVSYADSQIGLNAVDTC